MSRMTNRQDLTQAGHMQQYQRQPWSHIALLHPHWPAEARFGPQVPEAWHTTAAVVKTSCTLGHGHGLETAGITVGQAGKGWLWTCAAPLLQKLNSTIAVQANRQDPAYDATLRMSVVNIQQGMLYGHAKFKPWNRFLKKIQQLTSPCLIPMNANSRGEHFHWIVSQRKRSLHSLYRFFAFCDECRTECGRSWPVPCSQGQALAISCCHFHAW